MCHYTHHRSLLNRNPTGPKPRIVIHTVCFLPESIFFVTSIRGIQYIASLIIDFTCLFKTLAIIAPHKMLSFVDLT